MKPIRIFRHVDCEGPGYFVEFLDRHQVPHQLVAIDQGQSVPPQIDDVSGLVFMGGGMSVNDDLPWIADEVALIQRAAQAHLPVLGHCLGGQLISKALGGKVTRNPVQEFGWFDIEQVACKTSRDWLRDLPQRFTVYHWHGETFSIPQGAQLILKNSACAHQAFVYHNMLALQCHIEMTSDMVREWATGFGQELATPSATIQSPHAMLSDLDDRVSQLHRVADVLYTRWLAEVSRY